MFQVIQILQHIRDLAKDTKVFVFRCIAAVSNLCSRQQNNEHKHFSNFVWHSWSGCRYFDDKGLDHFTTYTLHFNILIMPKKNLIIPTLKALLYNSNLFWHWVFSCSWKLQTLERSANKHVCFYFTDNSDLIMWSHSWRQYELLWISCAILCSTKYLTAC